jgi:hypothetical protein
MRLVATAGLLLVLPACAVTGSPAGSASEDAIPEEAAAPAAETPPPPPLLERGLNALGIPPSDAGLIARGWAQQGIHENLGGAEQDDFRGVDDEPGTLELRQAVLVLETLPPEGEEFSVGGRLKTLYGTDAQGTRAAGMDVGGDSKGERFDILEIVASLDGGGRVPAKIELGKFLSPHGYESAEAPSNDFPSRGLLFTYATPTTHTGGRITARTSEATSVYYAAVRGWDNWEDPNGRLSHMLGASGQADGGKPGWAANATAGPEDPEGHHLRVLADATLTWKPGGGDTGLALNALRGSEEAAALDGSDARWYGAGAYVTRPLGGSLSAALRAELLRDDGGSRTGFDGRLGEVSAALTWRPIPRFDAFRVRLEGRWDRALSGTPFDGGRDRDQGTIALDWILEF